jgi:glyoxylase-like metal-dependent hydrolase (beta-lactamase superfamily II)
VVVGDVEVVSLIDAVGELAELAAAYPAVPAESWEPYRALYPETFAGSRWRLPVAIHVVRSEGKVVLVDTGVGPAGRWRFWTAEREGLLPAALEASGIRRESVDVVFLTHLHVDHLGWNTDESGEAFFPRARYVVHPEALMCALADPDRSHVRRCVEPLVGRFEWPGDDVELAPGVRPRMLPGHYPGHHGISIHSKGAQAELIADIAPHPALLDRPEWVFAFDDVNGASSTRAAMIRELVDSETLVVCGHYPGSGIGRVVRRDSRVVWEACP